MFAHAVGYPVFNACVLAVLSFNLSPIVARLENLLWGGAGSRSYYQMYGSTD